MEKGGDKKQFQLAKIPVAFKLLFPVPQQR